MSETDVASTLGELERKLRELEDELQAPAPPAAAAQPDGASPTASWRTVAPAPLPGPDSVAPTVAPAAPVAPAPPVPPASAQAQLDELLRFRGELERSAQQLMAEYERVLSSLRLALPLPASVAPVPLADVAATAPEPRQPAASAPDLDLAVLDGAITVDAGPFADLTALSGFEQAMGEVTGVRDVYVRGFEGARAIIDVTLDRPVAFGAELRPLSPVSFTITAADAGRLAVTIHST